MSMLLLVLTTLVASPFQDNFKRFTLELPEGWHFSPVAGDDSGAAFKKDGHAVPAHAMVRVFAAGGETLDSLVRESGAAVAKEPGYQLISEGQSALAGQPAYRRRVSYFINGDKNMVKLAEDRMLVAGDKAYVVHVETLASAFNTYEKDFDALFAGFAIAATGGGEVGAELLKGPFIGKWAMVGSESTLFELRADGTFDLDGTPGTYRVQSNELWALPQGGEEERFDWKVKGDELTLTSPNLGEPMRYKRWKKGGTKKK
jgi:hypothetical protein